MAISPPADIAWSLRDSSLDDPLRDQLAECWTAVTNSGGAVGFPAPPVRFSDVRPAVDALAKQVAAGSCVVIVAHDGEGVCGWVALERNTFMLAAHWGWVRRLQAHPRRQRQGIAPELLRRLEAFARDKWNLEFLQLSLRGGLGLESFYGPLGWREVGRIPGALRAGDGVDRDEVHMVKPLR